MGVNQLLITLGTGKDPYFSLNQTFTNDQGFVLKNVSRFEKFFSEMVLSPTPLRLTWLNITFILYAMGITGHSFSNAICSLPEAVVASLEPHNESCVSLQI